MEDIFGNQLKDSEWNKHHVFARCTAKGKGQSTRKFINQHGLLVPIDKEAHTKLHQSVEFPLIPTPSLIHRINMYISNLPEQNPYDRFISIARKFEDLAGRCPNSDHRSQAERIADNLQRQAPFILLGQVKLTEVKE